jgi:hypothetical protein
MPVGRTIPTWAFHRSRRLRPPDVRRRHWTWSSVGAGLPATAATLLLIVSCGGADRDEGTSDVQDTTVAATEEPSTTTATTPASSAPETSFADFVADADQVLGPLELDAGRRFAVLGYAFPSGPLGDGSIELLVEDPEDGWASEHEITVAGMPVSITAPGDLDADGLDEIQVDWVADEDTDFGLLYRIDVEELELVRIPFVRSELHEPMDDYAIVSVEPGFVSTSVERCDPGCTSYTVTWRYDSATDRLVVHTQPAPSSGASATRIPPGVIEDGTHYGYLIESSDGSFTFDRADVQADGSWTNVNPTLRTLPYAGSVPWASGTPIEVIVDDQRVASVSVTTSGPPTPSDPLRIPAGVIEDGTHYGYFVSYQPGAFVFDRVDVLPNGEWQNLNPMTRTLPIWVDLPLPPGTPIEVVIVDQHVARVATL